MKISVTSIYGGNVRHFRGTAAELRTALLDAFPWAGDFGTGLPTVIDRIAGAQALSVDIDFTLLEVVTSSEEER